jgi:hypothetical protein
VQRAGSVSKGTGVQTLSDYDFYVSDNAFSVNSAKTLGRYGIACKCIYNGPLTTKNFQLLNKTGHPSGCAPHRGCLCHTACFADAPNGVLLVKCRCD